MVVNASELDLTVFYWLFIVIPIVGCVLGVAAWLVSRHRGWIHPVLAGLAAFVTAVVLGWSGAALFDGLNG